jgi:hypothetical protein
LAQFARDLARSAESEGEEWENSDLASYLDGMSGWIEDMDGYFSNVGESIPEQPTWKLVAMILLAARSYE